MTGHNPTDRSRLIIKIHIVTDKNIIPLAIFIIFINTHVANVATNKIDIMVIKNHWPNKTINKGRKSRFYGLITYII